MNSLQLVRSFGCIIGIASLSIFIFQQENVQALEESLPGTMHHTPDIQLTNRANPKIDMGTLPEISNQNSNNSSKERRSNASLELSTLSSITQEDTDPDTDTVSYTILSTTPEGTQYSHIVELTPNSDGSYTIKGTALLANGSVEQNTYTITPSYNPQTNYTTYVLEGNLPNSRTRYLRISGDEMTITNQNLLQILAALNTSLT